MQVYDLIIIGSGAAGLSAAIYAARYRLNTLVIGEQFGGETALAGKIENYPGFKAVDGFELMNVIKEQASALQVQIVESKVIALTRSEHCFELTTDKNEVYQAHEIILAQGAERRRLGLPNEKELTGHGISYCVTCDGPLYRNKTIALVGSGDAAVKGLNLAAEYVEKIYLIVRGKEIKADPINYERMQALGEKVTVLYETEVTEAMGKKQLEKIILSKPYNGLSELTVDGLFVEIGAVPNVELAKQLGVELDEKGYIKVDTMMRTNIDGVFSAGDATNHFGGFKQDITAAATGAVAATSAYEDHKIHGDLCPWHARPTMNT